MPFRLIKYLYKLYDVWKKNHNFLDIDTSENAPRTKELEMSSRLTHEHLDFPSSATKRYGP